MFLRNKMILRVIMLNFLFIVNIYAENFNLLAVKQTIKHESEGMVYVNYLKNISTKDVHYVSIEYGNATIYKFYILLAIEDKKIIFTKYNFNPIGAYSFSVQYNKDIKFSIKDYLNNFIDETDIHNKDYESLDKIQFSTKKYFITLMKKNRIPISNIYLNKKEYLNNHYIEPVFNKKDELQYFFTYQDIYNEGDIMSQEFQRFITRDKISLNKIGTLCSLKLKDIEKILKQKKELKTYNKAFFKKLLFEKSIGKKTLTSYNNIAYYLQKAGANEEAVYLLEKIVAKFPNRTVAYINLGDAYWALGEKEKARKVYTTYIEQLCHKGLQMKIPKVVLERVEVK